MSRRTSSYGHSSYGAHSYHSNSSGRFHRRRKRRPSRNNGKMPLILGVIIAAIAVIAVIACIFLFGQSGKSTDEQTSKPASASSQKVREASKTQSSKAESFADPNKKGYYDQNVFIYDKQGYEMFYGSDDTAVRYAQTVSALKKAVGSEVTVYNMVVPAHSAFGLPAKYLSDASDQKANMEKIYASYTEDVKPVNIYNTLNQHKSEYTYFRTDNNWTSLGAYYAYQAFCSASHNKALSTAELSKGSIKDFGGSLLNATISGEQPDGNAELANHLDTVTYYDIPGNYTCMLMENGSTEEKEVPLIATFAEGSNAYSAFIWGSNPYMSIKKSSATVGTNKKLCIIKDSYGSAFAPFTVANYDEVYIIDPQLYDGNIVEYIQKNKFTDVLVLNSLMYANTTDKINELQSVIG